MSPRARAFRIALLVCFWLPVGNLPKLWALGGLSLAPSSLPVATMGTSYHVALTPSGGVAPYSLTATGLQGTGLSLVETNAGYSIGGVCTSEPGGISIQVTDSAQPTPNSGQFPYTLNCNPAPQIVNSAALPPGGVNTPYSVAFSTNAVYNPPGAAPYRWSLTQGSPPLPSGFTLSAAGVLTGTATAIGTSNFSVTFTDAWGATTTKQFQVSFYSVLVITTASLPSGVMGTPYPSGTALTVSGSNGASLTFSATGMPPGLSINASTGVISGTPTQAGTFTPNFTVSDSSLQTAMKQIAIVIQPAPGVAFTSPRELPGGTVGQTYQYQLQWSGGVPPYTITTTSVLPSWLSVSSAGAVSGIPPAAGVYGFSAKVTDSHTPNANSDTQSFSITVAGPLTITTLSTLPLATIHTQYSTALGASGGAGGYRWSGSGFPPWLTISTGGVVSGSPTVAGEYTFQVTVTDSDGVSASKSLTLPVSAGMLGFANTGLSPCLQNVICTAQFAAVGGVPPYVFSLPGNETVDGLSLSPNGALSGTPPGPLQIALPVTVTDAIGERATKSFPLAVVAKLSVTTTSLPSGSVGAGYVIILTATGGQRPYTWSVSSGSLPPGLTLDPVNGVIHGSPTATGTSTFSLEVQDVNQTSQPQSLSIAVTAATPLSITAPLQLPAGTLDTAYQTILGVTGGSGRYSWSVTAGSLPAGLSLAPTGLISGTPHTVQTATFTATVTDSNGNTAIASFSLQIVDPAAVNLIAPNPLPDGSVGTPYNYGIAVTGGTPPYTWSIPQGAIPTGLTFDSTTGVFSGTPTVKGLFTFLLTVTDSGGTGSSGDGNAVRDAAATRSSASGTYTIRITGPGDFQITTSQALPNGTPGQTYSATLMGSGGTPPYLWSLVSGSLPPGLTLGPGGQITGTPSAPGISTFNVQTIDSAGLTAISTFTIQIVDPNTPSISSYPAPPSGTVGVAYQAGFNAVGGHAPYIWAIGSGGLPPGLTLDPSSGAISGVPTQSGSFPFTLQVTDSYQAVSSQGFAIRINAATLQITTASPLPNGTLNVHYSFGFSVTGGTGPYNWSVSTGGLTPGLAIDPVTGILSGTPTVAGAFQFSISVADSNFNIASQAYQLTVETTGLTITTTSLPGGVVSSPYRSVLSATNGAPPYSWSIASGSLPVGISLDSSSGQLSGTPTAAGSSSFTIQVTDVTTATAQAMLGIVVSGVPFDIVTTALPAGMAGAAYSQTIQTTGANGAVAWSLKSGSLPAGLSLGAATGIVSGTPTQAGDFAFTVQAVDSAESTAVESFTLHIAAPAVAPSISLSGLSATLTPGDQPTADVILSAPYPLDLTVTATLTITPNLSDTTDLLFSNGQRTIQFTIPANTTSAALPFQAGTLPGTIVLSLRASADGADVTPTPAPSVSTQIVASAPVIRSVVAALQTGGFQLTIMGFSTTLDMKTAAFHFTPAAGATLKTTDVSVDVGALFTQWYANPASLATGSQFALTVPFTVAGNVSSIASVSMTLTNSVGSSAAVSSTLP